VVRFFLTDDGILATAAQSRDVATRLMVAGHSCDGGPDIIIVLTAVCNLTRLAWLLTDLAEVSRDSCARIGSCSSRPAARAMAEWPPAPTQPP
jgi:hypothetical protein